MKNHAVFLGFTVLRLTLVEKKQSLCRMKKLCCSAAVLATAFAITTPANAQILVSGDVESGPSVFTIQSDLTFPINTSGDAHVLAFDEWVSSDGDQTPVSFSSLTLSYVRNGTPGTTTFSTASLYDNFALTLGDLSPNDGYVFFSAIPVTAGDTLTLKAGTWNFTGEPGFNPQTVQTFTGNVFLTDGSGNRISGIVAAVPEPSQYGLIAGVGLLGWVVWRRKVRPAMAS